MTDQTHQEMLQKYAEAIVKVGLNIRAGQRLDHYACGEPRRSDSVRAAGA